MIIRPRPHCQEARSSLRSPRPAPLLRLLILSVALTHRLNAAPLETNYVAERWSINEGLPHNSLRWLAQTPDGFLWAGTGQGVARFDGTRFKGFTSADSPAIEDPHIRSLRVDPDGALWVLSENGSVARRERGRFARLPPAMGIPASGVHGLYGDGTNLFVVSDPQGRVYRLQNQRLVAWLDTRDAAPASEPFVGINVDYQGTVWVRYGTSLSWWDGQRWQRVVGHNSSEDFRALKTGPSRAGGMWISSPDGLRRLHRGVWDQRFLAYENPARSVQAVFEDRTGSVWVTHASGPLLRFDPDGRLTQWRGREGQADEAVKHLFEDASGNLWMATDTGLVQLRPKSHASTEPPGIVLEEVQADGQNLLRQEAGVEVALTLPPDTRTVEFRFTGVALDSTNRLQFRHRLDGVDSTWMTGAHSVALYSNVPPGRYYFRVSAARDGEAWNGREATATLTITPHLWQTWWFRTGGLVLAVGAALFVFHRRERLRQKSQEEHDQFCRRLIESQEAERQRIARELHDSLGQNLLLIKNRAVMGLKDNSSPERMREQLREISEASAGSVEEIRAIARALRPYQLDRLGLTKTLEDAAATVTTTGGLHIVTEVDPVDGLFAPDAEIAVYRLVQEGLNNIIKHAQAKSARLVVRRHRESVQIDLTDDGRGIDPDQKDGFGLTNLRERVRLLGGTLMVRAAAGQGTRLLATIPLSPPADWTGTLPS